MKKHLHNSLRALFLSLAVLLSLPMLAEKVEIDGIWYNLESEGKQAEVTYKGSFSDEYDEYSGVVVIPASVVYNGTTYSVTIIGNYAFSWCESLTSVTIPNSVTSIGDYAFRDCSGLISVTIGNGVESIGDYAFYKCSGLTSVTIGNSVKSIGAYAFSYCSGLPSLTIPNSVTSIGWDAFSGCSGLTSVTIGNSVESIGGYAFFNCDGLTSVTIPNSVTSIGTSAFSDCSGLTEMKVDANNSKYDSREGCNAIIETSSNTLISACQTTVIPNSVTSIGKSAFNGCSGLTSVTIPNSVTSIGGYAFSNCDGLQNVYCYAEKVPSTSSNTFNNSNYKNATLHVPTASIESYQTTEPWSSFGTIAALVEDLTLADGEEFENVEEKVYSTLTYTRALSKTNTWNALYVPFEIPMTAEFCQNYDVAYFNDVHCYDNYVGDKEDCVLGQDGVIDGMDMEVLKAQEGSVLNANYPYLIRAKNTDVLNMNIKVEDATLYSAKETTISCSSVFMKFDVTGIYTTQTAGELKGEYDVYAISGGGWKQALNANQQLKPFRLYLKLTSIDGSPVKATEGAMSRINIRVQGEDTETDIDELKGENGNVKTEIFDLSGRRVQKAHKGIFIQNGKKVIM